MKKCYKCNQTLSLDLFNKNKSKPDGLATECKNCKKQQDKEYQTKYKDKIRRSKHEYYLEHKEETIKRVCQYAKDNREEHNARGTKAKNKLKSEVFSVYSCGNPKCNHCGTTELELLTIDHVNGDGSKHRREIFNNNRSGGYKMYQWIKRNDYPKDFQVLCYNCQYRKRSIEMKPENPTHDQETRAAYVRSLKIECLQQYGECKCQCGEDDIVVLTLDHVNDDGAKHRRETNTRGVNFYFMIRKNGFPNDPPLQVLCMNCNIRKRNVKYQEGKDGQTNGSNGSAITV